MPDRLYLEQPFRAPGRRVLLFSLEFPVAAGNFRGRRHAAETPKAYDGHRRPIARPPRATPSLSALPGCVYSLIMILVADNDVSFLELAGHILNRDRQVFLALDAQQAFQLAADLGFSVALVDLDLKGEDGLSLIQKLRMSFPDLPIIAISSVLSGHQIEAAMELGVAEVLHKPITSDWKPVVERIRATRRR